MTITSLKGYFSLTLPETTADREPRFKQLLVLASTHSSMNHSSARQQGTLA
jgi:hypothetical protein